MQDLITMQEASALNEKAFTFEEKEDWKGIRQSVIKSTNPIKELVKEMKDRVAAVDSRKSKRKNVVKINAGPTVLTVGCCYYVCCVVFSIVPRSRVWICGGFVWLSILRLC